MSEIANVYDVIVIGAGPIGQNVADRARAAGLTVAVVERELVGGECTYWACIPSKALLRPVIAVADARRVDGARAAVTGSIDPAGVFGRRDRYVGNWDDSAEIARGVLGLPGADLVRGHGRLDGPHRVAVATPDDRLVVLTARHAVAICTGSRPALPDLPGIAEARPWTNRRATDSSSVPKRLAIVGGGPVGVEMATAWNGLGAAITLLSREPGLLARFEPFAGEMVALALKEAGVEVRTGLTVSELRRPGDTGPVTLILDDGSELEADEVLVAVGREPNTGDVGLDTAGLIPGSWLDVDDTCRVRGVEATGFTQWVMSIIAPGSRTRASTRRGLWVTRSACAPPAGRWTPRPGALMPLLPTITPSRRLSSPIRRSRRSACPPRKPRERVVAHRSSTSI